MNFSKKSVYFSYMSLHVLQPKMRSKGRFQMTTVTIEIPEIPHGHGLSFKKGVADGLLDCQGREETFHETHSASYQRGIEAGAELKREIVKLVKP